MDRNILLEVAPRDPADNSFKTLHLADIDAVGLYALADGITDWQPVITEWPTQTLDLSDAGELQPPNVNYGSIAFSITNNRAWESYVWTGAIATIWVGDDGAPFSSYEQIYAGVVGSLEVDGGRASVPLLAAEKNLRRNLLTATYAGTGGAEGPSTGEAKGVLKPWCSGRCLNITPVLVDPVNLIFQYHGYGTTDAVEAVYEAGLDLGAAISTVTTWSALEALTLNPGEWAAAPAIGAFRLGAVPSGVINADVRGAKNGATYISTLGPIVQHWMTASGISTSYIETSSYSGFTQTFGHYQTAQVEVADLVRDTIAKAGGYALTNSSGKIFAANYYGSKSAVALNEDGSSTIEVLRTSLKAAVPPAYRVRVGHSRSWTVLTTDQLAGQVAVDLTADADFLALVDRVTAAEDAVDAAEAAALVQAGQIDQIGADGWLTRSEKQFIIAQFAEATTEKTGLDAQATAQGITTDKTTYDNAYSALNTYLGTLSPAWNNTASNTAITRSTFNTKWGDYRNSKIALLKTFAANAATVAGAASSDATAALARLASISADGVLDRSEKIDLVQKKAAIDAEKTVLDSQADSLGVSRTAYDSSHTTLTSYLTGLSPAWNSTTTDTNITRTTFNTNFVNYYTARQNLLNAISTAAAQAVPTVNLVRLSLFEKGTTGWATLFNPNGIAGATTTGTTSGLPWVRQAFTATASSQQVSVGITSQFRFPLTAGSYVSYEIGVSSTGPISNQTLAIRYLNSSNATVGSSSVVLNSAQGTFNTKMGQINGPVPATTVKAEIELYVLTSGSGAGTITLTQPMVCPVHPAQNTRPFFVPGPNSDAGLTTDLLDATTGRAETATIGSTNLLIGVKARSNTGFTLSQSNAGSSVTVTASAFNVTFDTGVTRSYSGTSIGGLSYSTTYYFGISDPSLSGSSSYTYSVNEADMLNPGVIFLGYITTMASGGGGGSGGGGIQQPCVDPDAYVEVEGRGRIQARYIEAGQRILCLTVDETGTEYVEVLWNRIRENHVCELKAEGTRLVLSANTAVPSAPREYCPAHSAMVAPIGEHSFEWQAVHAGPVSDDLQPVSNIYLGGRVYGAAMDAAAPLIFTHNAKA